MDCESHSLRLSEVKDQQSSIPLAYTHIPEDQFTELYNKSHPLMDILGYQIDANWLRGWFYGKLISELCKKNGYQQRFITWISSVDDMMMKGLVSRLDINVQHKFSLDVHRVDQGKYMPATKSLYDEEWARFVSMRSKEWFPYTDLIINDIDPMRVRQQLVINQINAIIGSAKKNTIMLTRYIGGRDMQPADPVIDLLGSRFNYVAVHISPYGGKDVIIVCTDLVKNTKKKILAPVSEIHQMQMHQCGNPKEWCDCFIDYLIQAKQPSPAAS